MEIFPLHPWQVSIEEAIRIQKSLVQRICLKKLEKLKKIAAIDVTYREGEAIAAVLVFSYPELRLLEKRVASSAVQFPYVPGLLTFREGPSIIEAWQRVEKKVDLLMFDGQGIAHPRRMGIATHLGIYLKIPSLGCAKSKLVGRYLPLSDEKGARQPLYDGEELVGWVVRTKTHTRPVFVSPGNLIDFDTALEVVSNCSRGYRIPEPLRLAHIFVNKSKHAVSEKSSYPYTAR
jgi:deoxyribonuclease V